MKSEDYDSIETKCFECGRNWFKLSRMKEGQVLAECTHCGHAHTLDSVLGKKRRVPVLYWFSAPKNIERCMDCRSNLKIWDVSYNGRFANSKCENCGLLHTFKKPRFRGWRLIKVTRIVDDKVLDLKERLDLTEIKGIGQKRAETLNSVGINNVSDLVNSNVVILSSKTSISEKFLLKWIRQAKEFLNKKN